jgi:hypothetical protein
MVTCLCKFAASYSTKEVRGGREKGNKKETNKERKDTVIRDVTLFKFNNTHQLDTLHNHFHFIKTQSLDIFLASLTHPQEVLHGHSFGECSMLLYT